MPNLTIEMTDAELFALDLIAVDKQDWADNVLTDRARVAKEELKSDPAWMQAAVALASDGGDATDDWAVLLKGKELGLFKTAAEKAAAMEAEQATGVTVPDTTSPTPELVDQEVIKRKMALVGASDASQLNDIILKGTREAVKLLQAKSDGAWTDEQAARAAQLDQTEAAFEGLETVSELIKADIASGAITKTDEIASDPCWPSLGA